MSTEAFGESQVHDEELEVQILDAINKWLDRDVRPHVMALEHDDIYPREMVEQMIELVSSWGLQVIGAIAVLIVGRWAAGFIRNGMK